MSEFHQKSGSGFRGSGSGATDLEDVEHNVATATKVVDEDVNETEMFQTFNKTRHSVNNERCRRLTYSSSLATHRSSIADRVSMANNSSDDRGIEQNLWGVAATLFMALLIVNGMSYVIVEYGFFGGKTEYPKMNVVSSEYSSKNDLGMSGKGPTSGLTDYQFQLFLGFVMYATVVLTGLGLEYFMWRSVLNVAWDEGKEKMWKVAQFLFPILVATAVGLSIEGNFLCLPILAMSLWKLGFPETLMLTYSALYNKDDSFVQRLMDMIRGIGTIVHHSSSTLYVTMMLFHLLLPTPEILSVLPPLLMQHWFVLLKYNYKWIYVSIATIIEVWFEWTAFSNLEAFHKIHWINGTGLFAMLIAHWAYFGAGIIGIICLREKDEIMTENTDNFHRLHRMQSKRCLIDHHADEVLSLNVVDIDDTTEDYPEKNSAVGDTFFKRYSILIGVGVTCVIAAVSVSIPLAFSASNTAKGNDLCPQYCELYAAAAASCPYYVSYYVPEASHLESRDGCISECKTAQFSKTDSETTFDTDSLQCRMNHARMAIKEGALTNSMHCVHATISGHQRCRQDLASIKMQKEMELGKEVFYTPSDWLSPDNPEGISEFQALMASISFLVGLRGRLYISYPGDDQHQQDKFDCTSTDIRFRSADGSCNSISQPSMGKVGTIFTRNLKPSEPHKNGEADVAQISSMMKRDTNSFAPFNQLTSAWIQFMTHDWFQHDSSSSQGLKMQNIVTHWWDASQLYGSSQEEVDAVRADGGKLHLDGNDEMDYNASLPITGFHENWWAGLHILHTIFAREHNYIVDLLTQSYPSMTEDELFGTARNIIAALLAKIHTLEWTPTLLDNTVSDLGLNINWYGLQTVITEYFKGKEVPEEVKEIVDEMKVPSVFGSNYTTEQTLFNTPFYMTEEFVSVYRMHSLLPDEMKLEGGKSFSLQELAFTDARNLVSDPSKTTATLLRAFARTPAQALSLKNYPKSLFNLQIGNGKTINLAEVDISRDRERGIPRYNDARRQLLLTPYKSIDELTSDKEERKMLKSVYTDIEQVDFLVGCLADKDRPDGFAFGIVPYYIFVVMASRRLLSDRFFQEGLTEENYSKIGVTYLMEATFHDILARQFPNMGDKIPRNPFSNEWDFELI